MQQEPMTLLPEIHSVNSLILTSLNIMKSQKKILLNSKVGAIALAFSAIIEANLLYLVLLFRRRGKCRLNTDISYIRSIPVINKFRL